MTLLQGAGALLSVYDKEAQGRRLLRMEYPRGDGPDSIMLVNAIVADEAMSRDFEIDVEVLSDDAGIALDDVTGKMVTVTLVRDDGTLRYFNGYVFAFHLVKTDGGFAYYHMELRPWLAFLRLRRDCRAFHLLSLTELCDAIFVNYLGRDYQYRLLHEAPRLTLAIQYNESDHNHLHRRLEAAGMVYWYEHRIDGHTLFISDDSSRRTAIDGAGDMPYQSAAGAREDDGIDRWEAMRRIGSGKVTLNSYNFKYARAGLVERPTLNHQGKVAPYEVYEDTGTYGFSNDDDGAAMAARRMEAIDAAGQDYAASGNHRAVQPGRTFTMSGHFSGGYRMDADGAPQPDRAGRDYLILSARHTASNNYQNGRGAESSYRNSFTCLRNTIRWRPKIGFHSTDVRIYGVQTALVVGPRNEEIYTDQFGRVCLQFWWDRVGEFNEKSSPWVRVATNWAGSGYGQICLPRIGQEVTVQFLNGCCDRPVVTGSLFNSANMPPWDLPDHRSQSGVVTRSTRNGTPDNANVLRFEDLKGKEEVWLHAEKDQRIEVEHDESHTVGNDRGKTVGHDETIQVAHDRTETVGNDEKITIHNNRTEQVGHDEQIDIGHERSEHVGANEQVVIDGNRSELVLLAKEESILMGKSLFVGAAYQTTVIGAMNTSVGMAQVEEIGMAKTVIVGQESSLTAEVEHKITVGASVITITPTRITLLADEILIQGRQKVEVHGDDIDHNPG
ncbi:type VI secretion system Vgr family protein [Rugamonas sp.]|uniref:type VI secretion system Vgr family protein n=1 Tax=Rugamonas sp. TaxID=1926287 RepID=UPI0025CC5302|nr:type VI secretion system tip protein TssI/VgrG [Rugamonas sp.]